MMSENIRRVGRELKYKGAILDVYTDHMEFANGNTAEWIYHIVAAAVVPVTEDGKLVMVRQYRNALDRYTLEIPAGALDYAEVAGNCLRGKRTGGRDRISVRQPGVADQYPHNGRILQREDRGICRPASDSVPPAP